MSQYESSRPSESRISCWKDIWSFLIYSTSRTRFIYTRRPTVFNTNIVGRVQVYFLSTIMRLILRDMRNVQSTSKTQTDSPFRITVSCGAEIIPGISISGTNNSNQDLSTKAHSRSAAQEISHTYGKQHFITVPKRVHHCIPISGILILTFR
jgi:hypothetical protein